MGPRKEPVMWGTILVIGIRALITAVPAAEPVVAAFGGVDVLAGGLAMVVGLIVRKAVTANPNLPI